MTGSFIVLSLHQILLGWSNQGRWDGRGTQHAWKKWHILIRNLKVNRPHGRLWHRWEHNIKMELEEIGYEGSTGFIWPTGWVTISFLRTLLFAVREWESNWFLKEIFWYYDTISTDQTDDVVTITSSVMWMLLQLATLVPIANDVPTDTSSDWYVP
jgi:hypothetical protein